jgi:integrase
MDESNRAGPSNESLDRVVAAALKEIERLGYSRRSRKRYGAIWTHFVDFSRQNGAISSFSSDLAAKFVERCSVWDERSDQPGQGWRQHAVFGVKVLADFVRQGRIERRVTDLESIDLPPALEKGLKDYQQYARDRLLLRPSTLTVRSRAITVFLDFLSGRQVGALGQMRACHLSEFITGQGHLSAPTVSRVVSDVRSFLRFLTLRGILQKDLALELPKIRFPKDSQIPSVWDQDLIVKLLGVIDRSSPKGKRDYAILLLACRLGLRAGDIRRLRLDDLHWEESRIEVVQSKTSEPLSLPLTEEVGGALIEYLKGGRPQVEHREVFLKANSPFDPFPEGDSLYHIVSYWRQLAGVKFQTPRKRGVHSLRHSLAARLLELGTPFPTIADILGHSSLESTRIYAKADVEALRSVALDLEEVTHAQ